MTEYKCFWKSIEMFIMAVQNNTESNKILIGLLLQKIPREKKMKTRRKTTRNIVRNKQIVHPKKDQKMVCHKTILKCGKLYCS